MNIEELREYCLSKPAVTESFPFDESTLVFKVAGKMFLLTDLESTFGINIKCDPEVAVDLRERYDYVLPGYHMNKKYWNSVILDGRVEDKTLKDWIDASYDLVIAGLSKKERKEMGS